LATSEQEEETEDEIDEIVAKYKESIKGGVVDYSHISQPLAIQ